MTYIERNLFFLLHNIAPIYGDNQIKEWLSDVGLNMTDSYRDDSYSEFNSHPLLMHAVQWENIHLCEFFIRLGADINAVDNEGDSPLIWAIWGDSTEMIQFLLKEGAVVNHQNNDGNTPLLALIRSACPNERKKERVRILIEKGANPRIKNKNGWCALSWQEQRIARGFLDDPEILELLKQAAKNQENQEIAH